MLTLQNVLNIFTSGKTVEMGSDVQLAMDYYAAEAQKLTAELNSSYHTQDEIRSLMSQITGEEVDQSFRLFPPFYTDFGKNTHFGKNVFVNSACQFQDQGGVYIGNNVLIGPKVMLFTINHGLTPDKRGDHIFKPVRIEDNVWIGGGAIILPGVTVGNSAIVAAGAVVTRDVPEKTVVAGVPARKIKSIGDEND